MMEQQIKKDQPRQAESTAPEVNLNLPSQAEQKRLAETSFAEGKSFIDEGLRALRSAGQQAASERVVRENSTDQATEPVKAKAHHLAPAAVSRRQSGGEPGTEINDPSAERKQGEPEVAINQPGEAAAATPAPGWRSRLSAAVVGLAAMGAGMVGSANASNASARPDAARAQSSALNNADSVTRMAAGTAPGGPGTVRGVPAGTDVGDAADKVGGKADGVLRMAGGALNYLAGSVFESAGYDISHQRADLSAKTQVALSENAVAAFRESMHAKAHEYRNRMIQQAKNFESAEARWNMMNTPNTIFGGILGVYGLNFSPFAPGNRTDNYEGAVYMGQFTSGETEKDSGKNSYEYKLAHYFDIDAEDGYQAYIEKQLKYLDDAAKQVKALDKEHRVLPTLWGHALRGADRQSANNVILPGIPSMIGVAKKVVSGNDTSAYEPPPELDILDKRIPTDAPSPKNNPGVE